MCRLCETRKLAERAERVSRALKSGSTVNPDAIGELIRELRNDLVAYHNEEAFRVQAMAAVVGIVAEFEAAETGEEPTEKGATHCNPGTIN